MIEPMYFPMGELILLDTTGIIDLLVSPLCGPEVIDGFRGLHITSRLFAKHYSCLLWPHETLVDWLPMATVNHRQFVWEPDLYLMLQQSIYTGRNLIGTQPI